MRACDYRFFTDRLIQTRPPLRRESAIERASYDLFLQQGPVLAEAEKEGDIVFRNECPFMMKRHPLPTVHYGRRPPYVGEENYQFRRMYKVPYNKIGTV